MRFVYVGDFRHDWSTEEYVAEALERAGQTVHRLQETAVTCNDVLKECQVGDIMLFCKLKTKDCGTWFTDAARSSVCELLTDLSRKGVRVVCWQFDLLASDFDRSRFRWASSVAEHCNTFFTTDGYTAPKLANSIILRQGFPGPVTELRRGKSIPQYFCDVAFLGTVYGDRRQWYRELRTVMQRGVSIRSSSNSLRLYKNLRGDALFSVCRSAKLVVGPPWPYYAGYWSNRIYVVAGYGGCYAGPFVEGMTEEGWKWGHNFLHCPSPEAVKSALAERSVDDLRAIADAGQKLVFERHTYDHRIAKMLEVLR